jgi:hypothetical protein
MTYPKEIDESMSFVAGLSMKNPQINMLLVVDRLENRCDIDEVLVWTYKEDLVGMLFRGHNTHNLAVRFLLSSQSCTELLRKLTVLLQKRDEDFTSK